MQSPVVFTDANVLYAAALRDLLIELAVAKDITIRWSDAVHQEWTTALARNRPDLSADRIRRTLALLTSALPDALVADYDDLISSLQLPDVDDRHVLAAAIKGKCQVILTFNLAHFPADALAPHKLVAMHPDAFLSTLCTADPAPVISAAARVRARLTRPPMSTADYLFALTQGLLPETARALAPFQDQI
jgi:predicted nucleic acid-binding protein